MRKPEPALIDCAVWWVVGGAGVGGQLASLPTPTRSGYKFDGWYTSESGGTKVTTGTVFGDDAVVYARWTLNVRTDVASPDREVPGVRSGEESALVAPVAALTAEFTAGPNPVGMSSGKVSFYRNGSRVAYATLSIYDASGNLVRKIRVIDDAVGSQSRRKVSSWDMRDATGRPVSGGTYLVKGVLKTSGGKREKVSVVVGVR